MRNEAISGNRAIATLAVILAVILGPVTAGAGDSSDLATGFTIAKRASSSVIGTATDRKLCRYHVDDGLIHCNSEVNSSEAQEYIVESTSKPRFSGFGNNTSGRVTVTQGTRYAFSHAETVTLLNSGTAYVHCKLALQFQLANNDTLWVWHDEVRFRGSDTIAYVDSDGDHQADIAVRGTWNGKINGTRKWEPVDPTSTAYTAEQMRFPVRPYFGKTGGLRRNCRPSKVIVAQVTAAAPLVETDITGHLRSTLDVTDN